MSYNIASFAEPLKITEKQKETILPKEMVNSLVSLYPKSRKWLFEKVIP